MALSKAERDAVVALVGGAMEEATAAFEREVEGLRARVQLLEGQLTKAKSTGGAAVGVDLADRLAAGVRVYVSRTVGPLAERLTALESRGEVKYCGVWQAAGTYKKGNLCTRDGSLWVAVRDTTSAPPGPGPDWQLAAKGAR